MESIEKNCWSCANKIYVGDGDYICDTPQDVEEERGFVVTHWNKSKYPAPCGLKEWTDGEH